MIYRYRIFLLLSPLLYLTSAAQDSSKAWRSKLAFAVTVSNGSVKFPERSLHLDDALMIRMNNLNLSRHYRFEIGSSYRFEHLPLEMYASIGYWHLENGMILNNNLWEQDQRDYFPGTFQLYSVRFKQQRLSANMGSKFHITNWLYLHGGVSYVTTLQSKDWDGAFATAAATALYKPVMELHKHWQPGHWYGTYGLGLKWKIFFAEYYRQQSFRDYISNVSFRGKPYAITIGNNTNAGIAIGCKASLLLLQSLFNNKQSPQSSRYATLLSSK